MSAASSRALALSLGANLGIALAKFVVAAFTRSAALFTEAVHSTADCGNQVLLFLGMKQSQKAPTPKHPLGRGQAAFVASFLVALLLFSVGGVHCVVEGSHKCRHPELPHHRDRSLGAWGLAFVPAASAVPAAMITSMAPDGVSRRRLRNSASSGKTSSGATGSTSSICSTKRTSPPARIPAAPTPGVESVVAVRGEPAGVDGLF